MTQPIQRIYQEINQIKRSLQRGPPDDSFLEEKIFCIAKLLQSLPIASDDFVREEFIQLITKLERAGLSNSCHKAYEVYCQKLYSITLAPKKSLFWQMHHYVTDSLRQMPFKNRFSPIQKLPLMRSIEFLEEVRKLKTYKKKSTAITADHLKAILTTLQALKESSEWEDDLHVRVAIIQCTELLYDSMRNIESEILDFLEQEAEKFKLTSSGLYQTLSDLIDKNPTELEELLDSYSISYVLRRRYSLPNASENEIKILNPLLFSHDLAEISEQDHNQETIECLQKVTNVLGLSKKHVLSLIDKIGKCYPELKHFDRILSLYSITDNRMHYAKHSFTFETEKLLEIVNMFKGASVDPLWDEIFCWGSDGRSIPSAITDLKESEMPLYKTLIKRGTGLTFCISSIDKKFNISMSVKGSRYSRAQQIALFQTHITEHPFPALKTGYWEWMRYGGRWVNYRSNFAIDPELEAMLKDPTERPAKKEQKELFAEFPEFSLFFEPEKYREEAFIHSLDLQKMVSSIWHNDQLDSHVKESLLRLSGYIEIARKALPPAIESHDLEKKALEEILQVRSPTLRYHLVKQLFTALHSEEQAAFLGSQELENLTKFKKRALIWKILLTPMLIKKDLAKTLKPFLELLRKDYFKDAARSYSVFEMLCMLLQEDRIPLETRAHLLAMATTAGEQKKAGGKLIANLMAEKCFLSMNWLRDLKEAKDFLHIENCLQERFSLIMGIDTVDKLQEKYAETFAKFRDPLSIFTYAGNLHKKLRTYAEKEEVLFALKRYVEAVLNGSLREERYEKEPNDHLKQIFASKEGFKEQWIQGDSVSLDALIKESLLQDDAFDVKKFLHDRIIDGHIPKAKVPIFYYYLKEEKSFDQAKAELEALPSNTYVKLQIALLSLLEENLSTEEKVKRFISSVSPLIYELQEGEFQRDLNDLKELLLPLQKTMSIKEWIAVDTDSAEDIQACGTEVLGSCQNIHGDAELNKCLLSYLLDGKIRMIAIKNKEGKIMARCMIRILWDSAAKEPVLFQERTYQAAGVPTQVTYALTLMAQKRAKDLGIPHTSGGHKHPLTSLNTKAPFEYVDALAERGMNINSGKYTI
jgi:hypothetical protein